MTNANLDCWGLQRFCTFIMACLLMYCTNAWSEVYQWKDANGQMHFGDRAPVDKHSDNISNQLDRINISTDLSSPALMLKHAEQKEARKNEERQKLIKQQKSLTSLSEACMNARHYLTTIEGRVVFTDIHGKEVKVSEQERRNKVLKVKKIIRQNCH